MALQGETAASSDFWYSLPDRRSQQPKTISKTLKLLLDTRAPVLHEGADFACPSA